MMHEDTKTKKLRTALMGAAVLSLLLLFGGCASLKGRSDQYRDPNMDFGSIRSIAVLPFNNLSHDVGAAERVRDVLSNMLLATGGVYVVPSGEVTRGIMRVGILTPASPSIEEIKKLAGVIQVNAVITGTVKEYGEVRSGNSTSNVISLSLQMIETETGRIVWSASATEGGVTTADRLFGGGGQPSNDTTEKAINDLIEKLF